MILRIFTDGGARGNPGPAGIGVHIEDAQGSTRFDIGIAIGVATNNEAEYQAFLEALRWLGEHVDALKNEGEVTLQFLLDSKLVVEQLSKRWKIKEPRMLVLAQRCWTILGQLNVPYSISHIPREQNAQADALVNQALDAAAA